MDEIQVAVQVTFVRFGEASYLGRGAWHAKYQEIKQRLQEAREEITKLRACRERLERENTRLQERVRELETQSTQPQPVKLPLGDVLSGHQYGTGLIVLCVNVARIIGLRATSQVLQILFDWLGVEVDIPTYQTIRTWMQRIGLDRMQNAEQVSGGVWLVDHTNQIGKEKVLAILRVPEATLTCWEGPLRHEDVEVLTVMPGEAWKRGDVAKVYQELAERYGQASGPGVRWGRRVARTCGNTGRTARKARGHSRRQTSSG